MFINNQIKKNFNPLLILNISISVLSLLGLIALLTNMHPDFIFYQPTYSHLKYYSFVLGIIAFIFCSSFSIYLIVNKNKIKNVPYWLNIINLVLTSNFVLNFLFSILYLMPRMQGINGYEFHHIITGSNLVFNVIIPILGFIQFCFLLKNTKIPYKHLLFALIPTLIYLIVYTSLCLTHICDDGSISYKYDLYGFCTTNKLFLILAAFLILGNTAGISFVLIYLNQKITLSANQAKLILNCGLLVVSFIGVFWMFFYAFRSEDWLHASLNRFKYISNLSNMLVVVVSIISIIFYSQICKNKRKTLPEWLVIFKQAVAMFILLVFIAEFCATFNYFATQSFDKAIESIWRKLYRRHLIFEHFLTPLTTLAILIFVEHNSIKIKDCFISASLIGLYFLVYTIVLYCHINDTWTEDVSWDIYQILKYANYKVVWLLPILTYAFGFGLNILCRLLNKKVDSHYKVRSKNKYSFN